MPRPGRHQFRERNLRGFSIFCQHLKGVCTLLARADDLTTLSTTSLQETRHRLLDAYGTIVLLLQEVGNNNQNATGLQSDAIREPLESLKGLVQHLIAHITEELEKRDNIHFDQQLAVQYSTQVDTEKTGSGRKTIKITKDQLEHLRSLYFSWQKISELLGVSISTIQRRRREYGLSENLEKFSNISDDEFDSIYSGISQSENGPMTPNIGRRRFIGALRSRGQSIQRWRISECLRRVDPVGTALRWRMLIHRCKYYMPMPNSLWHIDSCHKLIRYKLIIHVCIDGKTRINMYASCHNNNKAQTVLSLFENAVGTWGLPSRVRSDYGMENYYVGVYMIHHCGENRGSIITGSSVHNCQVERLHRDVYSGVLVFYSQIFEELENEGLDVLNDVHIYSLHHIYIPRIEKSLQEFIQQMNNRPVSTERNQSPLQMWQSGMLQSINSDDIILSAADVDDYGIDPNSVSSVEEQDYQVAIEPPSIGHLDVNTIQLPDPMENNNNKGKTLFHQCIEVIENSI